MGFIGPTALSLFSAIRSTPGLRHIDILGMNLTHEAVALLRKIADDHEIHMHFHRLSDDDFGSTPDKVRHISKTSMARLLLPKLVEGRVIYIDGDTLVKRDLGELFDIDLEGNLIGGVRDFGSIKRINRMLDGIEWDRKSEIDKIMAPSSAADYVNSGVLLMDCAAIRAKNEICDAIKDFDRAAAYRHLDQDHINHVFRGSIKHLNPAWNSSWGQSQLQRARTTRIFGTSGETRREKTGILHYHGPVKPWHNVGFKKTKRYTAAVASYKFNKWLFDKSFPDIF